MYDVKYPEVVKELTLYKTKYESYKNDAIDYAIEAVLTLEKIKKLMESNNVEGRYFAGTGTAFEEELIRLLRSRKYD